MFSIILTLKVNVEIICIASYEYEFFDLIKEKKTFKIDFLLYTY